MKRPYRTMESRVREYLVYRKKLGFIPGSSGYHLLCMARRLDRTGYRGPITTKVALRWATDSKRAHEVTWATRLTHIRGLARYEALTDAATEIPPMGILGVRKRRMPPHIYSKNQLRNLLRAAAKIRSFGGHLAPHTMVTLLGLLASTGLRGNEALGLTLKEVDLEAGILTILNTKFRKSRLVPIDPTVVTALRRYIERRNEAFPQATTDRIFLTNFGTSLKLEWAEKVFRELRRRLGWKKVSGQVRMPRLHDFRHTFAVRRLMRWYEEGANVNQKIAHLATYLGHSEISGTYWYLTATPELLALSGRRFERFAHSLPKELA